MKPLDAVFWDAQQRPGRSNVLNAGRDPFGREYRQVIARLGLKPGDRMFEVGCGDTVVLEYVSRTYGVTPHGLDFSEVGLKLARDRLPAFRNNFARADYRTFNTQGATYDCVGSFGFIEHIDARQDVWELKFALTKPGGLCLVTWPNLQGVNLWFARAFTGAMSWHHTITPEEALAEAESAGFEVVNWGYFGGHRLFTTPERAWLRPLKTLINGGLAALSALNRPNGARTSPMIYGLFRRPNDP